MKGTHLGEFEEIVMLVIAAMKQDAYGLAIKKELEEQTQRSVAISAVHAACNRLQDKGLLSSEFGENHNDVAESEKDIQSNGKRTARPNGRLRTETTALGQNYT